MKDLQINDDFGEQGFTRLVAAFYQRVRTDELIGPLYPNSDWEGAEQRLRDFLVFRFGGSDRYVQERGHPRLRMRHAHFKIGIAERDRWLEHMQHAVKEACVPQPVAEVLMGFFNQAAEFMRNR